MLPTSWSAVGAGQTEAPPTETKSIEPSLSARAIRIETFTSLEQFDQCVRLQDAVWGYDPADMIRADVPAGLAHRRPGARRVRRRQHGRLRDGAAGLPQRPRLSALAHLGVLPELRNAASGRALKLAQRDEALARGIELMEWTFDPLEIKNAHLNIARLGAIVRRYQPNFYGPSSSPLHGGLPTDRIYAEWWLRSERVERALCGRAARSSTSPSASNVPAEIYAWKASRCRRDAAREVQAQQRQALEVGVCARPGRHWLRAQRAATAAFCSADGTSTTTALHLTNHV